MQVPEGKIEDRWTELYISFLDEASNYEITPTGESLLPLAELSYRQLKDFVDYEMEKIQNS